QSTLTRRLPLRRPSTTTSGRNSLRNIHLPTIPEHRSRIQPKPIRPLPSLARRLHVPSASHSHVPAVKGDLLSPAQLIPDNRLGGLPERRPHLSLDSMIKRHALSSRAERPRRSITLTTVRGKQTPPLLVILPLTPQSIRIRRRTTVHTRTTTSHRTTPRMNIYTDLTERRKLFEPDARKVHLPAGRRFVPSWGIPPGQSVVRLVQVRPRRLVGRRPRCISAGQGVA